jgi:hypothetical protein
MLIEQSMFYYYVMEYFIFKYAVGDDILKPYQFRMDELDGFRYRARVGIICANL